MNLDIELMEKVERYIDPCGFSTVKQHFRNPSSEISQVILVQKGHSLAEVAALLIAAPKDIATVDPFVSELLNSGAIRFGVDQLERCLPQTRKFATLLDEIDGSKKCYVLYLPPVYLVQVTEATWE